MTRALGCDVSFWNDSVNFNTMKAAGTSFVFCKASQQVEDSKFRTYWPAAKAAGLLRGAYHYLDWRMSEVAQANLFCSLLATDKGELPPVLDLEMDPNTASVMFAFAPEIEKEPHPYSLIRSSHPGGIEVDEQLTITANFAAIPRGISAAEVQARAWNFLSIVENTLGIIPMIYTGYYYWYSYGNTKEQTWARFPFWLPWYNKEEYVKTPAPWTHWDFWQYSSNGPGPTYGAQGLSMDMNYFNGTEEELRAWAHIDEPIIAHDVSIHGPHYCTVCGAYLADIDPIPVPPAPPAPPIYPAYKVKTGSHPNVRSGDGGSYAKMGYLIDDGAIIYVDSTDAQTGYCHIQPAWGFDNSGVRKYFELGGWVWTAFLEKQ